MNRADFYQIVTESCTNEKQFEMTYTKKNGELRKALCKLNDKQFDNEHIKGTGVHRETKFKNRNVFQYFDVNSNNYRTALIDNIIDVTINGKKELVID